jgi:hypothetical protein
LSAQDPQYEVHAEHPQQVRTALLELWKNLDAHGDLNAKFEWSYETPRQRPEVVFVLRTSGHIVGSMGFGVRTLRVGGQERRVAVLADLSVSPKHRSLAPALLLVKTAQEHTRAHFDCAYGWPNAKAEGVFVRARYKTLGRVVRYARVARYDAYVDRAENYADRLTAVGLPKPLTRLLTQRRVAAFGAGMLDSAERVKSWTSVLPLRREYHLDWVELTDPRLDELWQSARDEYRVVAERTTRFLNWRFSNDAVRVCLLTRRSDGQPRAYAVVRCDHGDAQIADIFGHHDALSPLLRLLYQQLCANPSIHVVSCLYLGDPLFVRLLEENGFERRDDKGRSVCISLGQLPNSLHDEVVHAEHWHLTASDEDV